MSLMWKLLATTILLSSIANAQDASDKVEDFLTEQFEENTRLKDVEVNVDSVKPLDDVKGWSAYIVNVEAKLKSKPKDVIRQKMVWFSDGDMITKDLTNMMTGEMLSLTIKPDFKAEYYKKDNLIYGDKNAKYKIAIFSDPLCPFCKKYVPGALKDMKKDPKKYAVYYYHFPLERLHPASVTLVKAAVAAEQKGIKDVVLKMYAVKVNPREKDVKKILEAFNKAVGSDITEKEIATKEVKDQIKFDNDVAINVMVGGTPTVYLDGKLDITKKKYLKVR